MCLWRATITGQEKSAVHNQLNHSKLRSRTSFWKLIRINLIEIKHLILKTKQESPPAWTQEAYHLQEGARCWPPPPPPAGWTWHPPPRLDWPLTWPPPSWTSPPSWIDLWPWPPWLDLTSPSLAGLTFDPDPPGWTWTPPDWIDLWPWPPAGPDPPPCGQTNKVKLLPSPSFGCGW